jgi:fructose 1,6-bisphosphatase
MFKVGDMITCKHTKYNFEVVEVRSESVITITSPRGNRKFQQIINGKEWYLDESYYRKDKLLKIKQKLNG